MISVGVVKLKNKAVVDVGGDLASTDGDISLAANATAKASVSSKATTMPKETDKGNAIYLGVSWLTGDNIADINVKDRKDGNGNSSKISAGGDFSAEANAVSEVSSSATVEGSDETFASSALAVLDYDSAANVNIGRSVEAKSVNASAENEVSGMSIEAANSNGEGDNHFVGNADYIKWNLKGDSNANVIAKKIKEKFNLSGVTQGKLQGFEEAFQKAEEYVTAGAGVAVVDTSNTANVNVAGGVELKATGPATEKKDDKDQPAGDVTLSANTHVDSLHHSVSGQANKMDQGTGSKVTVAAGVLYSNIENDAVVALQSDTTNHKGVTLVSENGSVNLKAETVQTYDPLATIRWSLSRLCRTGLKNCGKP